MKNSCETDDITIFTGFNMDASKNEIDNSLFIQNYFWSPNTSINKIIENYCLSKNFIKNLEIGPGYIPFKLATHFIGSNEKIANYTDVDIDCESFPFETDFFDFVYCRHVLEDIQNPDFALNEIIRVSKFGAYIETPSPLIEVTKNVDGTAFSEKYCGYIHHRYIVWSSIEKNEIYFLPKYSCVLDHFLNFDLYNQKYVYNFINNYPVYWNNYFIFSSSKTPRVIMYKNGVNFNISNVEEYIDLINKAINESIQNTNYFIQNFNK